MRYTDIAQITTSLAEDATAGATSAANVATSVGFFGELNQPETPKKKRNKKKNTESMTPVVIRRTPSA